MKAPRLHPQLPPEGKSAWCFYPMSKKRVPEQNWFTEPYERRKELMLEHGTSGRKFAGRVLQVVTGPGETGAALCRAGVDKVAFTGSTETGKRVMAAASFIRARPM